jgi:hypothetical protein
MDLVCHSKMLVPMCQTIEYHGPRNHNMHETFPLFDKFNGLEWLKIKLISKFKYKSLLPYLIKIQAV